MEQARIAGQYIAATVGPVRRIISGPLKRQRDTASAIAVQLRQTQGDDAPQLETDANLDELRIDEHIARIAPTLDDPSGEFATDLANVGTSSRSYQKVIRRVFTHWQRSSDPLHPETWTAFASRARAAILDMTIQSARGTTTVAVSSGILIAAITQHVLGLPDTSTYSLFEALKNCSITHFLHTKHRITLSSFNDTSYLTAIALSHGATNLITHR